MKRFLVTFLLLACVYACGQGILGLGKELKVENFRTSGRTQNGDMSWLLTGEQAAMRGTLTEVEGFLAKFTSKEGNVIEITSSSCRFMHSLREIKSDCALAVKLKGVTATGIGYDVYLDKRVLRIRSTVKIVIQRDAIPQKLKEEVKTKK